MKLFPLIKKILNPFESACFRIFSIYSNVCDICRYIFRVDRVVTFVPFNFRHAPPTADVHAGVGAPAVVGSVVRAVVPAGTASDRPLLEQHRPRPGKCFFRPNHCFYHFFQDKRFCKPFLEGRKYNWGYADMSLTDRLL